MVLILLCKGRAHHSHAGIPATHQSTQAFFQEDQWIIIGQDISMAIGLLMAMDTTMGITMGISMDITMGIRMGIRMDITMGIIMAIITSNMTKNC